MKAIFSRPQCVNSGYHIMSSHECHVLSNHRSFGFLLNSLCGSTSRKHQSPHCWPFVRGIHWSPANSPHKRPVTRENLPFGDVIMIYGPSNEKYHGHHHIIFQCLYIYRWLNAKRLDQITDALELRLFCPKPSIPWPLLTRLFIINLIVLRGKGMLIFHAIPQEVCGTRLRRALLKKKINFLQLVQIMASMTLPESVTVLRLFNHHSNSGLEWWEPSICTVCRLNGTK